MNEGTSRTGYVLVLIRDAALTELVRRILEENGLRVVTEADFDRARKKIGSGRPDLVVFDADAGPGGTEDAVLRLRSGARRPGLPIIVLEDRITHDLMERLAVAGTTEFILKPLAVEEFANLAMRVLRAGRRVSGDPIEIPASAGRPDLGVLAESATEVLTAVPAWLLVVDGELRIRFANRSFLAFRGLGLSDVLGGGIEHVLPAPEPEGRRILLAVQGAIERGVTETVPVARVTGEGGAERAVDLQVTPLTLMRERHALLILHDISERWNETEVIRREKRKLEEIVDGMGASLGVLDPDLKVVWSNRTFRDWFGEMWGRRFEHALRGLVLVGDTDPQRIFTEQEHISKEWAHFTANGDKRYFRNIILPTHGEDGALKELILVTQDLTEVTLRSEQHRLLRDLGNLLQSTLDLDRLLYIILTCATAGHALGFNRAFMFLTNEESNELVGTMGVGPGSREEAFAIWADLAGSRKSLSDLTSDYEQFRSATDHSLTRLVRGVRHALTGPDSEVEILARTVLENRVQVVRSVGEDDRVSERFRDTFHSREFVSVPLQSKGRVVGVLLADNVFSNRPISDEQIAVLELFAAPAGLAVDNARTYAALKRSLTKERQAQDALLQAERLATVGRLAAHVAHEIRNPLTTIGGFARAVLKHPDDEERVRSSVGIIAEEVARLEQILSGVMDFTRPSRPAPAMAQLNQVVRRVADTLSQECADRGVEMTLDLDPELPECMLDDTQMHQALLNVMRNALDVLAAHSSEGAAREIAVRTRRADEWLEAEVRDTGPGVPPELLDMMFEPFITGRVGGTGIGLAVVRKILYDHGGDAVVRNGEGGGAMFTLRLPLVTTDNS